MLDALLGAVFLVLLIAWANVANLLLAAGIARRGELAVPMFNFGSNSKRWIR